MLSAVYVRRICLFDQIKCQDIFGKVSEHKEIVFSNRQINSQVIAPSHSILQISSGENCVTDINRVAVL